ncbi:MAG TPA: alpha/beta hydrolase [Microlunatus sp.]
MSDVASLITSYPAAGGGPRPAVLVLPGGGYATLADHEGHDYAEWLRGLGLHAFVLRYPVAPARHPEPVTVAAAGLAYVRSGDHGLAVDPLRSGVIGSSAGGHLAGSLSVGLLGADAPRPDFAILCYPVVSFLEEAHEGSAQNLLGTEPSPESRAALSLDRLVDARTPPTFLWSTADDEAVPVGNTLRYAKALTEHSVPTELHLLPHGRHGLGLAPGVPEVAGWSRLCAQWLHRGGWAEPGAGAPA